MPGTNSFYPYGESSTNILNNSEYQTDSERSSGAQSGAIARSKMYNKQARQAAAGAYAVGALVAKSGKNADDSSAAALAANFQAAVNYQAAHFVASDVSVSGTTATATVAELATTAAADLPALFALSLVLDQALPAGASVAIASSLPDVTLSWPIYVGSEALDSDTITGGAITLLIDTVGAKAFFKAGGGGKLPSDLSPLCPNFKVERNGGKVKISADKIQLNSLTSMVSGGVWAWGKTRPTKPTGDNTKQWSRAELITTGKPYDGLYLGDVTPSDAVTEVLLWLPENKDGKVVLVPFIILSVDYLGGVYVVRKFVWDASAFGVESVDSYDGSTLDTFMQSYANSVISDEISNEIMEVDYSIFSVSLSGNKTVKRKVITVSAGECNMEGFTDGNKIPRFSTPANRIAYDESGQARAYWTRTKQNASSSIGVNTSGNFIGYTPTSSQYTRPSFVLPKDFKIQQRPDGSYTVYNDYGLVTLKDIKVSDSSSVTKIHVRENSGVYIFDYVSSNYNDSDRGCLFREEALAGTVGTSVTYPSGGAGQGASNWEAALPSSLRNLISEVPIKYKNATSVQETTARAFVPSIDEMYGTETNYGTGTQWNMMKVTANRIRHYNGSPINYWLRDAASSTTVNYMYTSGNYNSDGVNRQKYCVPAFTLPLTAPIRLLADGSYDLVPEDPALATQDISTMAETGTPVQLKDIPVSNASIKTTIYLKENGKDKPFLYLDADYENSGRGLLLKESVVNNRVTQGSALYESSNMHQACLSWFDTLDNAVKSKVEPITITYRWKNGSRGFATRTMEATAFLLTMVNYGYTITPNAYPGKPLPYFNGNGRRQAFIDGTQTISNYYTRDIESQNNSTYYWYGCVKADGSIDVLEYNGSYYIRPAITLPPDTWFLDNGDGTYTFVGDEPTADLSIEIDWPESDPLYARQWVYNTKGQYQTMLLGGVASTEDAPAYSPVLAENTWEMIAQACADNAPILDSWLVGDEKDEVINGETLTFVIVGKDHDDLADGSGKAPLTFGMKNLMAETRQMNATNTNSGSFAGSEMYIELSGTIYPNLPTELKDAIKAVNKKTSSGGGSSVIRTDAMYLWLFSEIEVFGAANYSCAGEGTQYPYFATTAERIKRLSNGAGAASYWWERSSYRANSGGFCRVITSGSAGNFPASNSLGVCFGFCI